MRKQPHIIIFNPDEMRWNTMGHMGNPAAVTPFLDEFAAREGVSFSNAFCQNTVCVPSRCSFFTGLYPHVNGHRTMSHLLHPGESNLFSELRDAGYYVWMNARNDLFAGQIEGWAESNADEIFYGGTAPKAPGPVHPADHQGKDKYSHFEGKLGLDQNGRNYSRDDEDVDAAVRKIQEYQGEQPLCLFLGLNDPHVPYQVEEPYFSAIDRTKLPRRIDAKQCTGKAKMLDLIRQYQDMGDYTEEDWGELRATYLGMCTKVDSQFRRLCQALEEKGIYDDCLIFFFSDHGDFAGDYGLTEKTQNTFEDCLTRIPFLIKPPKEKDDPKLAMGVSSALTELVDFYATAIDYAGVDPKRTHFGKSLRPILEKETSENRSYVFCEGGRLPEETHCDEFHSSGPDGPPESFVYWPKMKAQSDGTAHAKGTMIRDKRYKYVSRITGEDEFYDMEQDPDEMHNQIQNPVYKEKRMEMQIELMRWYQRTCDVVPHTYDNRFTNEMLWARVRPLCPPEHEEEVKEKIRGGIKQGILIQYLKTLKK